jgi:hypothetical protein
VSQVTLSEDQFGHGGGLKRVSDRWLGRCRDESRRVKRLFRSWKGREETP